MRLTLYKNGSKQSSIKIQPIAGTIVAYAGSSAPNGWLLCDGAVIAEANYPALSDAIKTNFNIGQEGAGNFRLPDLRGKVPIGAGTGVGANNLSGTGIINGSNLTTRTIGQSFGASSVTLTAAQTGFPTHDHLISELDHGSSTVSPQGSPSHPVTNDGNHRHEYGMAITDPYKGGGTNTPVNYFPEIFNNYGAGSPYNTTGPSAGSGHTFTISSSTSAIHDGSNNSNLVGYKSENASQSHTNVQPSLVVNYIIKT